ncbi:MULTISPECIES: putative quinol monooxygenase [Rhodopseudomonas]|uniref:putative quinol monooxygenase n=1 Tax=Rhodopseudomonas TaxID=1073 RepID=UPI001F373E57|nr:MULTISPECIES: putative quinol monooxygenase [Rhodopseudomonas]MDF3811210.1 putative quinol monooxygenase [Rhodopseudomonas sp. BAL398]WOK19542.1 putative quinol monooxygenase [Rhodopseudomonas sp. BAL398]
MMTTQSSSSVPTPSNGTQLTLIAFIRAKKGMGDELGRRLWTLVEPARAEPGNINYDLHRSNEDPDVWVLYENWKDASDLTAHFELPYMKAFVAALPEVLEGEMDLRRSAMVTTVAVKV